MSFRGRFLRTNAHIFYLLFQLFYSFFKSLVGKEVIVELKNDLRYRKVLLIMYKFNWQSFARECFRFVSNKFRSVYDLEVVRHFYEEFFGCFRTLIYILNDTRLLICLIGKKIALIRSIAAGLRYNAAANVFENLSVAVLQYNYWDIFNFYHIL